MIQHAVWLCLRFTLSYRDVEELLAERGLDISYESVRSWVLKFGPLIARRLRQVRPRPSDRQADAMDATQLAQARARSASMGRDVSAMSDDDIRQRVAERERRFREEAPTSAAQAATIILNGVKADQWRILVGRDAHNIDKLVRQSP
jgi:hypothetical protein